ncbi:MAG TPA: hypothetical protein VHR42_07970 [Clostridia bacterium]|nr:hypothetical protein [Clostridia bacterium]
MNDAGKTIRLDYLFNFLLLLSFAVVLILGYLVQNWHHSLGIADRVILAVFCLFNGSWWFLVKKEHLKGTILDLVGLFALVTALMGRGFNS